MKSFKKYLDIAIERKGGHAALESILPTVKTPQQLAEIDDSRYLAMMAKGVNQAGFHWQVIENKWPQFEEAFMGFNPALLANLPDEVWENYMTDTRVVRNWQKITSVQANAIFVYYLAQEHGSAAKFFANWPNTDQLGLTSYLKMHGSRLGGMTAAMMLRRMGWDAYLLSKDVCTALMQAGLDIKQQPTSKREFAAIQAAFDQWHQQTSLPYSHISKILAYSCGVNNSVYH